MRDRLESFVLGIMGRVMVFVAFDTMEAGTIFVAFRYLYELLVQSRALFGDLR